MVNSLSMKAHTHPWALLPMNLVLILVATSAQDLTLARIALIQFASKGMMLLTILTIRSRFATVRS